MFFHHFKYSIICLFKEKTSLFWTLVFPLALGTFMYIAFGNIVNETEIFKDIPVAVIASDSNKDYLLDVLESLSEDSDKKLIDIEVVDEEKATKLLADDQVIGIINTADASLTISSASLEASVLESILKEYKKESALMQDILEKHPEVFIKSTADVISEKSYYTEQHTSNGNQNPYTNYFYAIFAMSCLFAGFSSVVSINGIQANTSALGMRRCVSPCHKLIMIVSEFTALLLVHFVVEVIGFFYLSAIGVDFGNQIPAMFLTLLFGCAFGLGLGVLVGAIPKMGLAGKIGLVVAVGMIMSAFADLFVGGLMRTIEKSCPIVNRLNPAALIANSFYALNVYDNYEVFTRNIITLAVETVILVTIGFLLVRRNKYASL